jgi:hypothetical protein
MKLREGDPISLRDLTSALEGMIGCDLDVCTLFRASEHSSYLRGRLEVVFIRAMHPFGEAIALSFENAGSLTIAPNQVKYWYGVKPTREGEELHWFEIEVGSDVSVFIDEVPEWSAKKGQTQ